MVIVYPNQKIVTVHKAPANAENIYGVLNKSAGLSALRNLTNNEIKLYIYMALNQPGYCMAVSTLDIAANVGSTEDGMRKAIQGLVRKGYLVHNNGRSYDFYEDPYERLSGSDEVNSDKTPDLPREKEGLTNGNSICYPAKNKGEIIHENTLKNTVEYKKDDSGVDLSPDWKLIFERIKVNCFSHTMKRLEEAAGCKPDSRVIKRIISRNWTAFEKGLDQKEGYRLNTLVNLINDQYRKWEHVIAMEDAENLRDMEEVRRKPRINYDAIHRKEPEQEGLGDISALLDEMFPDID